MKSIRFTLLVPLVLFVLSFLVFPFAHVAAASGAPAIVAQDSAPSVPALPDVVKTGETLTGFALLFAALINVGKAIKPEWFPNTSAPAWTLVTQTITTVVLVGLQLAGKSDLVPVIDQNAGVLAKVITGALFLAYQLFAARNLHEHVLAGLPIVGTSYSNRTAGQNVTEVSVEHYTTQNQA
jgi:hypothetical protein